MSRMKVTYIEQLYNLIGITHIINHLSLLPRCHCHCNCLHYHSGSSHCHYLVERYCQYADSVCHQPQFQRRSQQCRQHHQQGIKLVCSSSMAISWSSLLLESIWEQQLVHSQPAEHFFPFFLQLQRFVVQPVAHLHPLVRTSTRSLMALMLA